MTDLHPFYKYMVSSIPIIISNYLPTTTESENVPRTSEERWGSWYPWVKTKTIVSKYGCSDFFMVDGRLIMTEKMYYALEHCGAMLLGQCLRTDDEGRAALEKLSSINKEYFLIRRDEYYEHDKRPYIYAALLLSMLIITLVVGE